LRLRIAFRPDPAAVQVEGEDDREKRTGHQGVDEIALVAGRFQRRAAETRHRLAAVTDRDAAAGRARNAGHRLRAITDRDAAARGARNARHRLAAVTDAGADADDRGGAAAARLAAAAIFTSLAGQD
jgi:hypothetical protein